MARSVNELRAAALEMTRNPSSDWKHYLDHLHLAQIFERYVQDDSHEALRLLVLKEFEGKLYSALAEAVDDGKTTETA